MLTSSRNKVYLLLLGAIVVAVLGAAIFRVAPLILTQKPARISSEKLNLQIFLPAKATVERKIDVDLDRDGTKEILVAFKLGKGASRDYLMLLTVKNDRYEKVYQRRLPGELVKILTADLHGDGNLEVIVYYKRLGRYATGESRSGILVLALKKGSVLKEWGREWLDDEPKAANIRLIKITNPKRQAIVLRSLSMGASGYTESVGIYGWRTKRYTKLFLIDLIFGHGMSGSFKFLDPDNSGVPMIETTEVTDTIGDYGFISTPIGWRITTWKWNGLRYVEQTQESKSLNLNEIERIKKLQDKVVEDKLGGEKYWGEVEEILPRSLTDEIKL